MTESRISDSIPATEGGGAAEAAVAMAKLWWLSLLRGLAALLLGIVLLIAPARGKPLLAQYMGMYWLASGLLSIVWGLRGARFTRLWLVAGAVGTIGGLAIVTHKFFAPPLEPALMVNLFGVIALLTGLLHVMGGYRIRREYGPRWSRGSFLLGLVQIVLGVLILVSPAEVPPGVAVLAVIWTLIGGLGLVRDALNLQRLHRLTGSAPFSFEREPDSQ